MIKIDAPMLSISALLTQISSETGKDMATTINSYARLLAVDLAFRTQPFGKNASIKQRSEMKIRNDISKVYATVNFLYSQIKAINEKAAGGFYKACMAGRWEDAERILRSIQTPQKDMKLLAFDRGQAHRENFSKGRIRGERVTTVRNTKPLQQYIARQQKKAGLAKGGWAACARLLGGTRGIPGWVSRHKKAQGYIIDQTKGKDPSVTLVNGVPYSREILSRDAMKQALRNVAMNMEKRLTMMLKRRTKK